MNPLIIIGAAVLAAGLLRDAFDMGEEVKPKKATKPREPKQVTGDGTPPKNQQQTPTEVPPKQPAAEVDDPPAGE